MSRLSAIQRREFALFARSNPDLSKLTTEQRRWVAGVVGVHPSELESAQAIAWQSGRPLTPHPGPSPGPTEGMSSIDRRELQLKTRG
jgi:hypothetical protein